MNGLKELLGDGIVWYFSKMKEFPYTRPAGIVSTRQLVIASAEAVLGLILFVGAKPLVRGIMKLRGMPKQANVQDTTQ